MASIDLNLDAQEQDAAELEMLLADLVSSVSELDQIESDLDAFSKTL
jgi:hypothetical protein